MTLAIFKLIFAATVPVIAAIIFYILDTKTKFGKLKNWSKQIVFGIAFGGIAVLGTEFGIEYGGFQINCRDAAPMVAGFLFGGPAGIIAGLIGGVERWFAASWGAGEFTKFACSLSTVLAGFYAAGLRVFMFERKRPTWGMALSCGLVMETIHLAMIFITNLADERAALLVVDTCFDPMVIANGLSVMIASIAVGLLSGELKFSHFFRFERREKVPIIKTILRWLLLAFGVSMFASNMLNFVMQSNMVKNDVEMEIRQTLAEVLEDVTDASESFMFTIAELLNEEITMDDNYNLDQLAQQYRVTEISLVDQNGIITDSNVPEYIGYDMASSPQSEDFLVLLEGEKMAYAKPYEPTGMNPDVSRKYAAIALDSGFLMVGYDKEAFQREVKEQLGSMVENRKVGESGGIIIMDPETEMIAMSESLELIDFSSNGKLNIHADGEVTVVTLDNKQYFAIFLQQSSYYVLALYPFEEAGMNRSISLYASFLSMVIIFAFMFFLIYILIRKIVVKKIQNMTGSLSVISSGNLNEVVDVRSNKEFASLSDDINATVETLKRYIAEAAARIDEELEFAKTIQSSALPTNFPDEDKQYQLYALTRPAKEVGGDFYDFYEEQPGRLTFTVADVSGKGIPAAMFMMRSKSLLKALSREGKRVDEIFVEANKTLVEGNDAGMFVTAWQASLDLTSGRIEYANAGHNYPMIRRGNGQFVLCKEKVNFVLAGLERSRYELRNMEIEPGDIIVQYTDGANEATNEAGEMYGLDRMLDVLNAREYDSLKEMCEELLQDIDRFVGSAEQFDDITILAMKWKG